MSDDNFKFITEKRMGKLRRQHAATLTRIAERRAEIEIELASLAEQEDAVLDKTMARLQIDTDGPFRGLRVADGKYVHAVYCSCPSCQAELNNTTVTAATEIMLARGLVHADQAPRLLHEAQMMDKQRGPPVIH